MNFALAINNSISSKEYKMHVPDTESSNGKATLKPDSRHEDSLASEGGEHKLDNDRGRDESSRTPPRVRFLKSNGNLQKYNLMGSKIIPAKRSILTNKHHMSKESCVFERLSNTQTIASLHRRYLTNDTRGERSSSAPPMRTRTSKKKVISKNNSKEADHNKIAPLMSFERLAGKHTALSLIRRRDSNNLRGRKPEREMRKMRSTSRGGTPFERWKSEPDVSREGRYQFFDDGSYSFLSGSSAGPPIFIEFSSRMTILMCNSNNPDDDEIEMDTVNLGLNGALAQYENSGLSTKELAIEIMETLFLRDLFDGIKWNVGEPHERELTTPLGEKGYSFFIDASVKKKGGKDFDYVSASAKIIFIHETHEILVENYNFVEGKRQAKI